jgi:two-component system sensor histidine kinase/response regulator
MIFNQNFTVLIIDDAQDTIDLIRVILEDQGIDCISARNGERGITIAREGQVDLILLDILMPETDGFEVCRQLKSDPQLKDIPVIFITAKGDDDSIARGFELGAQDYIFKPFNRYEMLSRVQAHLRILAQRRDLSTLIGVKDRVLAIISHEIRNQFATMISIYDLFREDVEKSGNSAFGSHLTRMNSSLNETQDLFDNLITWSKNQRGKLILTSRKVHVYSVIQEVEHALHSSLAHKEINLNIQVDPGLFIMTDELLASLILRNFITNAIKFSYRGGSIEVKDQKHEAGLSISVIDHGIGIEPAIREQLFDIEKNPTTQGTENEKGTGIGLIICRDFAETIEANLGFESAPGEGAEFYLSFGPGAII